MGSDWYSEIVDRGLEQGDIFRGFPVPIVEAPFDQLIGMVTDAKPRVGIHVHDVMVVSQSCDLDTRKLSAVLLSPMFSLADVYEKFPHLKGKEGAESLRRGGVESLYLLPPCQITGLEHDSLVLNFRELATVPFGLLEGFRDTIKRRSRLATPYREDMASRVAKFISRVAFPVSYPSIDKVGITVSEKSNLAKSSSNKNSVQMLDSPEGPRGS